MGVIYYRRKDGHICRLSLSQYKALKSRLANKKAREVNHATAAPVLDLHQP